MSCHARVQCTTMTFRIKSSSWINQQLLLKDFGLSSDPSCYKRGSVAETGAGFDRTSRPKVSARKASRPLESVIRRPFPGTTGQLTAVPSTFHKNPNAIATTVVRSSATLSATLNFLTSCCTERGPLTAAFRRRITTKYLPIHRHRRARGDAPGVRAETRDVQDSDFVTDGPRSARDANGNGATRYSRRDSELWGQETCSTTVPGHRRGQPDFLSSRSSCCRRANALRGLGLGLGLEDDQRAFFGSPGRFNEFPQETSRFRLGVPIAPQR